MIANIIIGIPSIGIGKIIYTDLKYTIIRFSVFGDFVYSLILRSYFFSKKRE